MYLFLKLVGNSSNLVVTPFYLPKAIFYSIIFLFLLISPLASSSLEDFVPYSFLITREDKREFLFSHTFTDTTALDTFDEWFSHIRPNNFEKLAHLPNFKSLSGNYRHLIGFFEDAPNYVIKCQRTKVGKVNIARIHDCNCLNLHRIIEAKRLRSYCNEKNFNHLVIPQKWAYHLPLAPDELTDKNYIVVAEKKDILSVQEGTTILQNTPLNDAMDALDELYDLIIHTGLEDTGASNIRIITKNDSFFGFLILDTEILRFEIKKRAHLNDTTHKIIATYILYGLHGFSSRLPEHLKGYWTTKKRDFVKRNKR